MERTSRFWPLSLISAGVALVVMLALAGPGRTTLALPTCVEDPAYPNCIEIPFECGPYTAVECAPSATAAAIGRTQTVAVLLTVTAGGQAGGSQAAATSTPTRTPTRTPTGTPTAAAAPLAQTAAATLPPSATRAPATAAAVTLIATPTSRVAAGAEVLRCAPGSLVELVGAARPGSGLIVLFDGRPVGGGLSDSGGRFLITLRIGAERPGLYPVEVRERDGRALARAFGCEVPEVATPTSAPTPIRATPTQAPGAP